MDATYKVHLLGMTRITCRAIIELMPINLVLQNCSGSPTQIITQLHKINFRVVGGGTLYTYTINEIHMGRNVRHIMHHLSLPRHIWVVKGCLLTWQWLHHSYFYDEVGRNVNDFLPR